MNDIFRNFFLLISLGMCLAIATVCGYVLTGVHSVDCAMLVCVVPKASPVVQGNLLDTAH